MVEAKMTEIPGLIRAAWAAGRVPFLWGPPGLGKSAVVRQVVEADGRRLKDIRVTMTNPVDHMGYPYRDGDATRFSKPFSFPAEDEDPFFDELNSGTPAVQACCYRAILDRVFGEYRIPDKCRIIAAGNNVGDRGVTYRMPSPLANRFLHIDVVPDLDAWMAWALRSGILPEVAGFLRWRANLLFAFDPERDSKAFPTPRTWESVSKVLQVVRPDAVHNGDTFPYVAMCVGDGAASEFCAFLRSEKDLPDIKAILEGRPQPCPSEPSVLYMLAARLTQELIGTKDGAVVNNILRFTETMPSDEFAIVAVKDAFAGGAKDRLIKAPAFATWAKRFKYVF